jgi:hypothetical protein
MEMQDNFFKKLSDLAVATQDINVSLSDYKSAVYAYLNFKATGTHKKKITFDIFHVLAVSLYNYPHEVPESIVKPIIPLHIYEEIEQTKDEYPFDMHFEQFKATYMK